MTLGPSIKHRNSTWSFTLLAIGALMVAFMGSAAVAAPADETVDFNRDVRRILSENCFKCHGPDAKERKNGRKVLRLDLPESARADLGKGQHAIVPRHPEKSEL